MPFTNHSSANGSAKRLQTLLQELNDAAPNFTHVDRRDSLSDEIAEQHSVVSPLGQCVDISPGGAVKRYRVEAKSFIAETIYAPAGSTIYVRYQASAHLLILYEEGVRRQGETAIRGLFASTLRGFAKKLTFVPAGLCFREWHEANTSVRITYLYLDPARFDEFANTAVSYTPRLLFEDSVLWETAAKLRSAIERTRDQSTPYLYAIANVLAHELSGAGQAARTSHHNRGGLAGWQMRLIASYIDEHLDQQISLETLARLARLSLYHFCRAFKQSFRTSPHRYHVQRRVEHAKRLLSDRRMSITEIGLSVGYPYPGCFSIAFRKITGRTPSEFRRDITISAGDVSA